MSKALTTRVITGIIFGIVVISLMFYSDLTRGLLMAIIGIGSSIEILTISSTKRTSLILRSVLLVIIAILAYTTPLNSLYIHLFTAAICLFHLLLMGSLYMNKPRIISWIPALLLLYPLGAILIVINQLMINNTEEQFVLMAVMGLIWTADSFAFFVGKQLGRRKLFPRISPKKTWEGFYGGLSATVFAGIFIAFYGGTSDYVIWILISLVCGVGGTMGDLVQSSIKRYYGVKDSGKILPGHGGLFDRFDSFIFVVPFVYLILQLRNLF